MANPLDVTALTPAELDRIEDALEGLGEGSLELEPEVSAAVRSRLESYQEVLTLARAALPMVEARSGLLDGVLAEAAASAASPAPEPASEGLWARLRRSFALPGLALAATAALLVMWLRPVPEDRPGELSAASTAGSAGAVEAPGSATGEAPRVEPARALSPAVEVEAEAEEAAADVASKAVGDPEASASMKKEAARPATKPAPMKKSKSKLDDVFGGAPSAKQDEPAAVDPGDKSSQREALEKADKLRRRGRCEEASAAYRSLEGVGGATEAQALVGLGLCAEFNGDAGAASGLFARARKLAAVDGLIAAGRKQMEGLKLNKAME